MRVARRREPSGKVRALYGSSSVTFWKWQNYGDTKRPVVARVSGVRGTNRESERIFRAENYPRNLCLSCYLGRKSGFADAVE